MNPKIAPVIEEITAVLKKHDMMGLVIVANETHADFVIRVDTSWSCARIEQADDKGFFVRIRSKREEYPSKEAQLYSLDKTVGAFISYTHILPDLQNQIRHLIAMIAEKVTIEDNTKRED